MKRNEKIKRLMKYIMSELFKTITEEDACYSGYGYNYEEFINKHYKSVSARIKNIQKEE